jgi:5-(aminomethyl)-3-furanmethanol phosphate kinase
MLTVVKLGGSHALSPALQSWAAALAPCRDCVIVPGGGPFADAVRTAQPVMGFDDRAAHHMAILAMEQYACALASLDERLVLCESTDAMQLALNQARVPVWLPKQMVLAASEIPWSWDVTSDSLAAWLTGQIGAERLLLVKHGEWATETVTPADLVTRGVVDPAFAGFVAASRAPAFVVGPADHARAAAALRAGTPVGTRIV